ncbi:MAG TPA: hypothetical protein VF846_12975 [Thermoanaerobaculia bacterium]|jgi:hypothetical protein
MHDMVPRIRGRRPAFGLLLLFLFGFGCAGSVPRTKYPEMTREEMFLALSTHTWVHKNVEFLKKQMFERVPYGRLQLRSNGTYDYDLQLEPTDDYDMAGRWNFRKTGARSGVLHLTREPKGEIDVALFEFVTDDRMIVRAAYVDGEYLRREPRLDPLPGSPENLPEVRLPEALLRLVGTRWRLVSDAPTPQTPVELQVLPDGTVLEVRGAEGCVGEDGVSDGVRRRVANRPDGGCVMEVPYTNRFSWRPPFLWVRSWIYLPVDDVGAERFIHIPFGDRVSALLSFVPSGGLPREMVLELSGVRPGGTFIMREAALVDGTFVTLQELVTLTIDEGAESGSVRRHLHLDRTVVNGSPTLVVFSYAAQPAEAPHIWTHGFR